jgi:hypothetical protein
MAALCSWRVSLGAKCEGVHLRKRAIIIGIFCLLGGATCTAQAEEKPAEAPSPWLLLPTFANNPKLGTSLGVLGAYLRKFDAQSQLSMFGATAQHTSTNSTVASAFARSSFGADQHRLTAIAIAGAIKNDYEDFLGSGVPLRSEDHIRGFVGRYLYRMQNDWFIGGQVVATNYQIVGQSALDDDVLGMLGLTGFKAGGVGLVIYHDTRDRPDSPNRGWMFNVNNIAYRKGIEGSNDFDVYRVDYRHFWSHGDGHVLALRQSNQWTVNAPPAAYAPVLVRGYTPGENLGKSMSSIEVEERYRLAARWTATVFAGAACLYGANRSGCTQSANLFPSAGAGVQYLLKPEQGIVANMEFAIGKDGNRALILKMGYSW